MRSNAEPGHIHGESQKQLDIVAADFLTDSFSDAAKRSDVPQIDHW